MARLPKGRRQTSKRLSPGGEVRLWVRSHPPRRRWHQALSLLLVAVALWSALTLLVFSLRWGFQLMLDPEALPGLHGGLFGSAPAQAETVTLADLEAAIAADGQQLGQLLRLREAQSQQDFWLLPVQAQSSSETGAAAIQELRLYRLMVELPTPLLSPIASLPVAPLADDVVLAPLQGTPQQIAPTRQPFPLTQVSQLSPAPTEGFWLMLQGQWQRSATTLRYGQIVFFNPRQQSLEGLLQWSTPTSWLPRWTDLDGADPPDLLIDQTVGLEPALRGYRLQRRQRAAVQLLPISLTAVPTDLVDSNRAYHQALLLARSSLWAPALNQLQALKSKLNQQWPPAAEAQLKLVQLHAERTRQQADRKWSVPSQQILASLVDSRWEIALKQLEAAPTAQEALMQTLANEEGRFWKRVTAALRIQPAAPAVLVWGGLILKAQQDEQTALTWLTDQKASAAARSRFLAIANSPVQLAQTPQVATPVSATADNGPAVQSIVGAATRRPTIDLAQWQPWDSAQTMQLGAGESWYEIVVTGWQLGGSWTFDGPASQLWTGSAPAALKQSLAPALGKLSLLTQQRGQTVEVPLRMQGLRLDNGHLQLLTTGPGQTSGIAHANQSLLRLTAAAGTPASGNGVVVAALQRQIEPLIPGLPAADLTALLAEAPLHTHDVTGDSQPEWLLTLPQTVLDRLVALTAGCSSPCETVFSPGTTPKTLIVTHAGQILYSDLFLPQTLVAITQPQPSRAATLVVKQGDHYGFQAYASERQQFE